MICLRCGRCCIEPLIAPLPDGTTKPAHEVCKYLVREGDQTRCTIHGQTLLDPWEQTACGRFGMERRARHDAPCHVALFYRARARGT